MREEKGRAREAGVSVSAIAGALGVSRQRVQQMFKQLNR
jgi:Mn-dependent DtxR family transcriptional regulator